jgi:hypothetical protein
MIVYGDHERVVSPREALVSLAHEAALLDALSPGARRSERASRLLIDSGEIAQGIIDDLFKRRGVDAMGRVEVLCGRLVDVAARALARSERGERVLGAGAAREIAERLMRARLPEEIAVKVPEGYAFYALYPELYIEAAAALKDVDRDRLVVLGIRSIGVSLAAAVAAGAASARPAITLRPVGHPFQRSLRVAPSLERRILERAEERMYAIADEGPGLSGSSFGSVADWLEDRGVSPSRIAFFPSHGGDLGPFASERHRARWARARRCAVSFEDIFVFVGSGGTRLSGLIEGCVGAKVTSIEDISGGRWRAKLYRGERAWPPACPHRERRKYIAIAGGEVVVAKFAGLGRHGDATLARAERLYQAGFVPRARGLAHGFLISDWHSDARPLDLAGTFERARVIERVGRYIGYLARELPAKQPGASPSRLLEMARFNASEAIGPEIGAQFDQFARSVTAIEGAARPVCTDNKLHAWEWLALPDGRLLKSDALDHHASHDLIGPQDPAWDIVGASVELGLDDEEQAMLIEHVGRASSYRADRGVLAFYTACYLGFQLGLFSMAVTIDGASDEAERARLTRARDGYAARLRRLLERARGREWG